MLPHEEAFYGGAAGGGKSDALLMAALQFVDIPDYTALILRRTFPDLAQPDAIMDRAEGWLMPTDAKPRGNKAWVFPSGARLVFGFMMHDKDRYQYQSAQFDFIGFDELTQFSELQFTYLFSRLRKPEDSPVPYVRMRSASNPGNVGHEWVKKRYIGEDGQGVPEMPFIPALLEDNPSLGIEDYERQLAKLDPVTREQLRWGNWDIGVQGNMFKKESFTLENGYQKDGSLIMRYWDLAATEKQTVKDDPDYTVGALCVFDNEYQFHIADVVRFRGRPAEVENMVKATAISDGKDIPIRIEEEGGASGKIVIDNYVRKILLGWNVLGIRQSKDKKARASPYSAYAENGNVKMVRGVWNSDCIKEHEAFFNPDLHDDQVDAISGAFNEMVLAIEEAEGIIVVDNQKAISPV